MSGRIDRQTDGGRALRAEKGLVQRRSERGREETLGNRERTVVIGSPFIGSQHSAVVGDAIPNFLVPWKEPNKITCKLTDCTVALGAGVRFYSA